MSVVSKRRIPQSVYLDPETIEKLDKLSAKTRKRVSALCREYIEVGCEKT